jgi:hypothetical protein
MADPAPLQCKEKVVPTRYALTRTGFTVALAAVMAAALPAAHAAGDVQVSYVKPAEFIDIGFGSMERERNMESLTQSFKRLAKQLPDGQTLKLEVLDVDLAGEVHPGSVRDIRIVRGGVDWPRIHLRYALLAGDKTLQSGDNRLADMSYLFSQPSFSQRDGPLPYEQRMIDHWFTETFPSANP